MAISHAAEALCARGIRKSFGAHDVLKGVDLAARKGDVIATHEMGFARTVANHVVFLRHGLVEEQGPPAEVLGHPKSEPLAKFLGRF